MPQICNLRLASCRLENRSCFYEIHPQQNIDIIVWYIKVNVTRLILEQQLFLFQQTKRSETIKILFEADIVTETETMMGVLRINGYPWRRTFIPLKLWRRGTLSRQILQALMLQLYLPINRNSLWQHYESWSGWSVFIKSLAFWRRRANHHKNPF